MYRTLIKIVGAICLILGPLGEAIWSLVWPGTSGAPADFNVAAIAANPSGAEVGLGLDLLIILLIPASLFAGRVLEAGTRALAGVGTGILFLGSLLFTYGLVGDAVLVAANATGGTATAQAFFDSPVVSTAVLIGIVGQLAGFVLLGIAALRSRLIPIWAGVLLIAWNVVQVVGTAAGIPPLEALAAAMLLAAYAACAVRLFRPTAGRPTVALVDSASDIAPATAH
ncbi:hypothetical protein BH11ACT3_BH11ACT3_18730 [soil metagenome]